MTDKQSAQPRVLIMEDDYIVGLDMVEQAKVLGLLIDGPHATLAEGQAAAKSVKPDLAILDIELTDGDVFPLAEKLSEANIPIIFHSGHTDTGDLDERFPKAHICAKPCPPNIILDILADKRRAA
ncbi:MAG: response regulator [Sphingomonadaceae bacterium]|jgi:two-component system, response regulator PdtaR